ncbi:MULTISPECIES: TetR/AcrR family transcriptional regulator [Methanobacterium]|uniref:Transcriptional regulator n=1 Tax=Methanobacterium bryantii TaxID=2161 RepID=A0A2A2H9W9_METBR|nr:MULTISPECIES: TetR/AcrR family transcriptional regulator [Methanobacterium]OEC86991.1 transcriptional regulator [Methanobacterium sp. A39]PAV06054.1 transcriptional regulator [Methanobacterium bryantii]
MSLIARKELEKEQRRNDILNAAEKLFFSKGYENVSLKDIAKEVKLGRSTLYLYFENKEELFFAIVLRGTRILYKMINDEVKKGKSSFSKLAGFRNAYYNFAKEHQDYLKAYNYLLSGRFDLAGIEPSEYKLFPSSEGKLYSEYKKKFEEIYIRNLEKGIIPNFPIPKFTTSEYLNEILILRREMLNIFSSAVEQGKKEGIVRPDVNSVEVTVLQTLIANSIDNLPPDLKDLLESQNISQKEFLKDVGELMGNMISNRKNIRKTK